MNKHGFPKKVQFLWTQKCVDIFVEPVFGINFSYKLPESADIITVPTRYIEFTVHLY